MQNRQESKNTPPNHKNELWIAIGDLHDETDNFCRITELPSASGVIITGDLTMLGGAQKAEKVLKTIKSAGLPVYAQIGNMDKGDINQFLNEMGINLHDHVYALTPEIAIFGVGGSTPTPFKTPSEFPEDAYATWLNECWQKAKKYPRQILVSHTPPKDTPCDKIGTGAHVGSTAVREFIEKCQPNICLCGHIHEARAVCEIGHTKILNPGMLNDGGYIIIHCKADGELDAELKILPE